MENVERDLFRMAKKGDISAFEKLMEAYHKKIFNIALKVSANREEASELAQQVFLKAYKSIRHLDNECILPVWLYKIAGEICIGNKSEMEYVPASRTVKLDKAGVAGKTIV